MADRGLDDSVHSTPRASAPTEARNNTTAVQAEGGGSRPCTRCTLHLVRNSITARLIDMLERVSEQPKTKVVQTSGQPRYHLLDDCLEFFQSLLKPHIVRGGGLLFFHSHAARKIVQLDQVDKRFGRGLKKI